MLTGGRLAIIAFAAALVIGAEPVKAQVPYTVNGRPATRTEAIFMLNHRLPFGDYWLNRRTGYWGIITRAGPSAPLGNI